MRNTKNFYVIYVYKCFLKNTGRSYSSFKRNIDKKILELDFKSLDDKWGKKWQKIKNQNKKYKENTYRKFYILSMFPYPSGSLHMGHFRVYTISDVISRFKRMQGYDVIHPIGWDAFGLPAENAAIERNISAAEWTSQNIMKMKQQFSKMNIDFDWDREITTCLPSYYKWTQLLFLKFYNEGYAYQKEEYVNWDPVESTVLANEQIDSLGRSWRSGAIVEKKKLKQWFLRITDFSESLLKDISTLKDWPERVKIMQKNWIGKSTGVEILFTLKYKNIKNLPNLFKDIYVFTPYPNALFHLQYIVLSPFHPIVSELALKDSNLQMFLKNISSIGIYSKKGFLLENIQAYNQFIPDFSFPVYVSSYILDSYGCDAIMGIPAYNSHDFQFCKENSLEIGTSKAIDEDTNGMVFNGNSEHSSKIFSEKATQLILKMESLNLCRTVTHWKLKDWLISRQRFWGTPIPIVYCSNCGTIPVPESKLPVLLPKKPVIKGSSGSPLTSDEEFLHTNCPKCNGPAKRDTDTMDTFVDSSWYFIRFTDPQNSEEPFNIERASQLLPVDLYIGGIEHAILHLLYSRFFMKFAIKTKLLKDINNGEPFSKLITQGMVHGKTYVDPITGRFLKPDELDLNNPMFPKILNSNITPKIKYEKMSKSKHNGVNPIKYIDIYGADCVRAHILFSAPITEVLKWDETKIIGMQRWLNKLFRIVHEIDLTKTTNMKSYQVKWDNLNSSEKELWITVQKTITDITHFFSKNYQLNTAVSSLIKLTIKLDSSRNNISNNLYFHVTEILLKLIAPITPAVAEELYSYLYSENHSIFNSSWPLADTSVQNETIQAGIQINGKLRFRLTLPYNCTDKNIILQFILKSDQGKQWIKDKYITNNIKNVIIAPGNKVINLILS
ncbi:leucine-tRNA ligase [Pneumocystis carinii B80]|uniref:leucine--tRNA ligase n=1 Tax=Pneumocystis carinii (strain B80) TaxID=1408658 RepID=A0A0W4ZF14_PNEC8|nr:leucine-tRNA ligase [Pneumocystis carinii B80]KTW26966.1 leucine-tRNA ligase [Pneumocystis carinii B80]